MSLVTLNWPAPTNWTSLWGQGSGRPKIMDEKKISMAKKLHEDSSNSINDICKTLGVSRATFYRYMKTNHS